MSRILLQAVERNWGLIGPGDWREKVWKIRNDASYILIVTFIQDDIPVPDQTITGTLSREDYDNLVKLLNEPWSEETASACDGSAWEFKLYGKNNRKFEKVRELDYIYGIEPFESIKNILKKYENNNPGIVSGNEISLEQAELICKRKLLHPCEILCGFTDIGNAYVPDIYCEKAEDFDKHLDLYMDADTEMISKDTGELLYAPWNDEEVNDRIMKGRYYPIREKPDYAKEQGDA